MINYVDKHVFRNCRSDLSRITGRGPAGNVTALDDLREYDMVRNDIILINLYKQNGKIVQRCVYAGRTGLVGNGVEYLSEQDREWAEAERLKILEVAKTEPLAEKLIIG